MPYSVGDSNLPANVKKLSAKLQRQWIKVFNSTLANCEGEDCEAQAFRVANGVIKKRKNMAEYPIKCNCGSWNEVSFGTKEITCISCQGKQIFTWKEVEDESVEKCYDMEYYQPYGGAISFDDVDSYSEASEAAYNVSRVKSMFDAIYMNIQNDKEMSSDQKIAAIEQATKEMVKRIQYPKEHKGFKEKISNLIFGSGSNSIRIGADPKIYWGPISDPNNRFIVTKDANDEYRWLAIYSNKFEDRTKETLSEESHKEYESWVDATKQYPEARIWHVPGSDFGIADLVTYADGFSIASGTFYKGFEDVAEKLAGMTDLGLSHGFVYKPEDKSEDGVYQRYRTFEISVLPLSKAANPYTAFTLDLFKEEVKMGLTAEKREFLAKTLGEDRVGKLESLLPQLNKDLEDAGIGWKEFVEAMEPKSDQTSEATSEEKEPEGEEKTEGDSATGSSSVIDTKELAAAFKAVVTEALAPVNEIVAKMQTDIAELQRSDDEKISEKLSPRTDVSKIVGAERPSESSSNIIESEAVKGLDKVDDKSDEGGAVAAAREIIDELMLGKRAAG